MTDPGRVDDTDVAAAVIARLDLAGLTLATAESLTGGLIGAALTSVPGSSRVYRGGVVSYATDLKAVLAGVDEATLAELGPIAPETAAEMARGIAARCSADVGVAVTGVAGPDQQDSHPVGQVFVALAVEEVVVVVEHRFHGDRTAIRAATVEAALRLVLAHVPERYTEPSRS